MATKTVHSLQEIKLAQDEWRAWRTVCAELERSEVHLNEDHRLATALRLWGEYLVSLRMEQGEEVSLSAHSAAIDEFYARGMELVES